MHNHKFEFLIDQNFWPLVFYSPSLNVAISTIMKNGSVAIEAWAKLYDFECINMQDQHLIFNSEKTPTFITVLRDPVERAISAIHMLQVQYKNFGLKITWDNFRCLEYAYDPHLFPQSAVIPTKSKDNQVSINCRDLHDQGISWSDVLREYDTISRITNDNVFFYAFENQDVLEPITKYLNLPYKCSFIGNNSFTKYGESKTTVSEDYRHYLKKVYEYDYKLIDSVKFVNT